MCINSSTLTSRSLIIAIISSCCFASVSNGQILRNDNDDNTITALSFSNYDLNNDDELRDDDDVPTSSYPTSWAALNSIVGVVELVTCDLHDRYFLCWNHIFIDGDAEYWI